MASADDLIKEITQNLVAYMNTPSQERRKQRSRPDEHWKYRWFGMLPTAISMLFRRRW